MNDWFKKHTDTVMVLGGILSAVIWMQGKFSNEDETINKLVTEMTVVKNIMYNMNQEMNDLNSDVNQLTTDISVVKTVLIMQKIMPQELAVKEE